jgi:hypothetical protein
VKIFGIRLARLFESNEKAVGVASRSKNITESTVTNAVQFLKVIDRKFTMCRIDGNQDDRVVVVKALIFERELRVGRCFICLSEDENSFRGLTSAIQPSEHASRGGSSPSFFI